MGEGLRCLSGFERCGKRGADGVYGAGIRLIAKSLLIPVSSPILAQALLQNAGCIFIFGSEPDAVVEDEINRCGRAPCFAVGPDRCDHFDLVGLRTEGKLPQRSRNAGAWFDGRAAI